MHVQKKRPRRRSSGFLKGLLVLLLTVGVSFGGAALWQRLQNASAPDTQAGTIRYSTDPSKAFAPSGEDDSSPPENSLPADSTAPSVPSFEASSVAPEEPSSPEQPASTVTAAYAVEGQAALSDGVDASYFDDAIFFGDSISTGITAYNIANNTACIAAIGVSPNTVLNTPYIPTREGGKVTVLEAAKSYGERNKVYIMLGGNGLWQDKDGFIADYQKFLDAVKAQYPGAVIYIQSMTPVARGVEAQYPSVTHAKVLEYNTAIAQLAKDNQLPFVNVFEALCDSDGYLPEGVSADGLHLSAEYYFKWFDYLKIHTVK